MRLRAPGLAAAEVWRLCGPLAVPGSGLPDPDPADSESADSESASPLGLFALDSPELSGPDSLTFLGSKTPLRVKAALRAAFIIAEPGVDLFLAEPGVNLATASKSDPKVPVLRVRSIHEAMAAILSALSDRIHRSVPYAFGPGNRIAPTAVVEGCLEGDVTVGAGAYVGKGSFIGAGTRIGPNAVIEENCILGRNCVVQAGAVIGCSGFGFFGTSVLASMPHPAGVEIGDECWIGANAVVAAGVLNPTVLGRGCKLDSHVQIAHNVRLGEGCLLASQSGIAGSTIAGNRLRMGGASSVDGHLNLGDDVSVAACSGVTKDFPDKAVVAGFPARPIKEWRRQLIALKRLSEAG